MWITNEPVDTVIKRVIHSNGVKEI